MRVFAGLPMPGAIIQRINCILSFFKERHKGLKLVKPEGIHITLFFFGELSEDKVNEIISLMDSPDIHRQKIKTAINGIGQFPGRGNPRVIFLNIKEGKDKIIEYYNTYLKLIGQAGYKSQDKDKKYEPHITIARNKREKLKYNYLEDAPGIEEVFYLDRCVLFNSVLKPQGAEYFPLKTVMFK